MTMYFRSVYFVFGSVAAIKGQWQRLLLGSVAVVGVNSRGRGSVAGGVAPELY